MAMPPPRPDNTMPETKIPAPSTEQRAEFVIWVASYPKSGNTWLQTVIRHAGRSQGFPNQDIDVYRLIAEKREPQVVASVRPRVSPGPTTVLKTHRAWREGGRLHGELNLKTMGFVYVMRNPLDMLLSYINFSRQQYGRRKESAEYQQSLFIDLLGFDKPYAFEDWAAMSLDKIPRANLDHALTRFTDLDTDIPVISGTTRSTWLEHCRSWKAASGHMTGVFLRYEDLLAGPQHFHPLRKIFRFTEQQIDEAVESVNAAQRARRGQQVFFNKMTSHYYLDYFSPDVLRRFLDKFEAPLAELGYGNLPATRS